MQNFHLFIASCFEALPTQIPQVIKNIIESNVPVEYVHIIVGGCPKEKKQLCNGIDIVHVKYRCFEFTPMIYIANNPNAYEFDYAFFTHDTTRIGPKFYNLIKEKIALLKTTSFDTIRIENKEPSMNIGIYSKKIIIQNATKLLSLAIENNDKSELFKLKHKLCEYEDFLFSINNLKLEETSKNKSYVFTGIEGNTANGKIRKYDAIDLIKFQSNNSHIQSIDICNISNIKY